MIPILRQHPEDPTKAQLFWDGKEFDISTLKAIQWLDILINPVLTAAALREKDKKASRPSKIEGWGIHL